MEPSLLRHIGANIKIYRKSRGMTLEELAARIHKSRASVSKYEAGLVALDVETLFEIAGALGVAPVQLFDCLPLEHTPVRQPSRNPFLQGDTLYMYNLYEGEIFFSIIKLFYNDSLGLMEATLFYKMDDEDGADRSRCYCIYHGQVLSEGFVLSCILKNIHNELETALLNLAIPMRNISEVCGMLCGLEVNTLEPVALKILLSRTKLPRTAELRERLTFSSHSFKEMRSKNKLFVRAD